MGPEKTQIATSTIHYLMCKVQEIEQHPGLESVLYSGITSIRMKNVSQLFFPSWNMLDQSSHLYRKEGSTDGYIFIVLEQGHVSLHKWLNFSDLRP